MSVIDSHNNILASANTYGQMNRGIQQYISAATTAATIASGQITAQRYPIPFNIFGGTTASPTLGTGVTGGYITRFTHFTAVATNPALLGIETLLGQCTANGGTGTFVDGSIMPTKVLRIQDTNNSTITGASLVFACVTTTMVGAGTYTLTITYTDQDGNTGNTATLTIPNVSVKNSAFFVIPHLAAGDTGITDITAITLTGTSGVIQIYGVLPLAWSFDSASVSLKNPVSPLTTAFPRIQIANTDTLNVYRFNSATATPSYTQFSVIADS